MVKILGSAFDLSYRRTTPYPMDASSVFNTIEEARVYARNNDTEAYVPYAGQIISVLENGAIYKLVKDDTIPETDGRKHYKLAIIGSNNDNDDRYLRKDIAETVKFLMTFLEGINVKGVSTLEEIKLLKNIVSNNFSAGSTGFGITQDAQGNYHLDIDFVNIRRKLTVSEIQVQQSSYIGGKQWNTAAGIICSAVEDKGAAWRCFFNTTDAEGRTVRNTFAAGDQALCETFNLDKQAGGTLGNHQYWRLVVGKGDDYIDLSKTDCSAGSDAPQVGDNVVQLGNRTDLSRQGAICWDSVTDGGPYVRVYDGINSYHLPQPKIDLNPTESVIKAKLVSEATGINVDDVLDDMKVDLDLMKSQTDKEYTLWFFDYAPTLNNIPASEWTTEVLKVMHEHDMFYNQLTGFGYRFEKTGSAWGWSDITDHLTLKAMENAAKAQDTADNKRRVFVEQPADNQAYDVGDLWTNATYPSSAPYTYQNDALVCKTAKAAGAAFSIDHWKSSSMATTAYLENLGDRITIAVTDSSAGIEDARDLARQGISDAYDAYLEALDALGVARNALGKAAENTSAIEVTNKSISALVKGVHIDENGNITNINTSGLVTTGDFNTLLSKKVSFDGDGHITNIDKTGLVTDSNLVKIFAEKTAEDGYVKKSYIAAFITELPDGRYQSNALVSADNIKLEGLVTANEYFKILKDGSMEASKGTFRGDIIQGNGINKMDADGSASFANGKISWGADGNPVFEGKVTTVSNGTRIEIDPGTNSIMMYNQNNLVVGSISFLNEDWQGTTNTYPRLRLRSYGGDEIISEVTIANGFMTMLQEFRGDIYSCNISPSGGIGFYKNTVNTKSYPNI